MVIRKKKACFFSSFPNERLKYGFEEYKLNRKTKNENKSSEQTI